ncbi:MAG: phenylalanine--tRNA ligase beta subunit-related protein [Thermoprotei archaeon]|nr:phenylalanine--tRNA ligase beta subunit-related protein [Thermoprotei archaeon]
MAGILEVSPELSRIGVFIVYAVVRNVRVLETPERVANIMAEEEAKVRSTFETPARLTDNPIIQAYRRFLWRLGIDPTKIRPSSEALARRVLRGAPLPRINSIVDIGNVVSLRTLIPIGLYDMDSLSPPLTLKLSRGGEVFLPVGSEGSDVLSRGVPIIVDSKGLVIHVYPHRDSRLSMIRGETRNVLITLCGVPGVQRDLVMGAAKAVVDMILNINPLAEASEFGVVV